MPGRPIVFISDFGLEDEFVGTCHGVIARVSRESRVIDLTHGIPPQDMLRAAVVLGQSVPYMPDDAVYLAVVDPGVGTERRAVAVEAGTGALLVGPDNGVLSLAWEGLGGAVRAVEILTPPAVGEGPSRTFHGRDVFAPAAALLAAAGALGDLGPDVDVAGLGSVSVPEPDVGAGAIDGEVLGVDRFGNVQLNIRPEHLTRAGLDAAPHLVVRTIWQAERVRRVSTFGEAPLGELAALIDSRGWLAVVRNGGNAASALRLELGGPVRIESPDEPALPGG